jgi:hypothetical protein
MSPHYKGYYVATHNARGNKKINLFKLKKIKITVTIWEYKKKIDSHSIRVHLT